MAGKSQPWAVSALTTSTPADLTHIRFRRVGPDDCFMSTPAAFKSVHASGWAVTAGASWVWRNSSVSRTIFRRKRSL
jgi:hypothetical protein